MPGKKYFKEDVLKWANYYSKVLNMSAVSRRFNIHISTISKYFKKYKEKLNIKYKDEIQEELFRQDKILCLPITGCGKIKTLDEFYFRKNSGKYKEQCKECRLKYIMKWNKNNKDYKNNYNKEYGKKNRKKISAQEKERRENDIQFRLIKNIRNRINNALNGNIKKTTAKEYMGCSVEELKTHIEQQFYSHPRTGEKMRWDNYGYSSWHIDHIKPLSLFNLSKKEELLEAGHYTNLQPLWAEENLSKGDRYEYTR